ncbi:MAG: thioredoxin [Clostridia bacterium]|nr:thioredoxin [Clostridia bacterium]
MEIKLTSSNFEGEVMKSNVPVLVDFWAPWCGPCRMVAPVVEAVANEYDGKIKVGKVNVDEEGTIAAQFGIVSIPTIIIFVNGKPVDKLIGAHSQDDFEDMIEKYI